MYLSHPVRRLREDPISGESIDLVVELGACDAETLRETVDSAGGSVKEDLGFDAWRVRVPQERIDDVCELDGLVRVETADTLSLAVDENVDEEGEGSRT